MEIPAATPCAPGAEAMKIEFHLEAQLRTVSGTEKIALDVPQNCTLEAAVGQLAERLGEAVRPHLLNEAGAVRSSLLVAVNGESVYADESSSVTLSESDHILLMPPIAGG